MGRPSPRLVGIVTVIFCILLLSKRFPTETGGGSEAGRRDSRCSRVFSVSDSRLVWESGADSAGGCRASALDRPSTRRCLERRQTVTGRRTLLVFIGDSRARILFEKLRDELHLQWEGRTIQEVFPFEVSFPNVTVQVLGAPKLCIAGYAVGFHPADNILKLACDVSASSPFLRAQFFWRPHVDAGYLDTLSELAEACGRGAHCPDVVVMTAGMWYAKPFEARDHAVPLQQRVLEFRQDTAPLADRLRLLATYSPVVYRLDGPELTEGHGEKSHVGGVIMTINAVAFGVISQFSGAQVWTSSLADTVRFYHTVCLSTRINHTAKTKSVRSECLDPNHVGDAVRVNAVHTLLNFACRDYYERQPGRCCGFVT